MTGRRTARGFTLLETLLAASLGAALVLMVVGVMGFMDRAEARQAARIEEMDNLARVQRVMSRTFAMLVVADPNSSSAFRSAVNRDTVRLGGRTLTAEGVPRERVILEADESRTLDVAMRRARVAGGGAVQRLEVVLDRPPVPRNFARGLTGSLADSVQANLDERDDEFRPVLAGPVRGVFELRPDAATRRMGLRPVVNPDDPRVGWTLWWRPLVDDRSLDVDPTDDAEAVPIASGLTVCTWRAFIKKERSETLRVMSTLEVPAYMEMEVRTLGGQHANWMFEVQWSIGDDGTEGEGGEGKEGATADGRGGATAGSGTPQGSGGRLRARESTAEDRR